MAPQQQAKKPLKPWVVLAIVVAGVIALASPDKGDGGVRGSQRTDPCEIPSTFEVSDDFNEAPADEYYDRCYESIADRLND